MLLVLGGILFCIGKSLGAVGFVLLLIGLIGLSKK